MKEFFKKIWGWIRKDGLLHIGVSAVISVVVGVFFILIREWDLVFPMAGFITLFIGVAKEVYDSLKKDEPIEWHDIWCDLIGIGIGEIINLIIFLLL